MNHTRTVRLPGVTVWSEIIAEGNNRHYEQVPQPCTLPTAPFVSTDAQPKIGISTMEFNNPDGTLVATKNDSMPSTVWIWSLKLLRPYAVLVHQNPVKSISWHPTISDLLLIQCAPEGGDSAQGVVYLWSSAWQQPRAIPVPLGKPSGSIFVKWVLTSPSAQGTSSTGSTAPPLTGGTSDRRSNSPEKDENRIMFLFGDKEKYLIGYVADEFIPDEIEDSENAHEELEELVDSQDPSWGKMDWVQSPTLPKVPEKPDHLFPASDGVIPDTQFSPKPVPKDAAQFRPRTSTRAR